MDRNGEVFHVAYERKYEHTSEELDCIWTVQTCVSFYYQLGAKPMQWFDLAALKIMTEHLPGVLEKVFHDSEAQWRGSVFGSVSTCNMLSLASCPDWRDQLYQALEIEAGEWSYNLF